MRYQNWNIYEICFFVFGNTRHDSPISVESRDTDETSSTTIILRYEIDMWSQWQSFNLAYGWVEEKRYGGFPEESI